MVDSVEPETYSRPSGLDDAALRRHTGANHGKEGALTGRAGLENKATSVLDAAAKLGFDYSSGIINQYQYDNGLAALAENRDYVEALTGDNILRTGAKATKNSLVGFGTGAVAAWAAYGKVGKTFDRMGLENNAGKVADHAIAGTGNVVFGAVKFAGRIAVTVLGGVAGMFIAPKVSATIGDFIEGACKFCGVSDEKSQSIGNTLKKITGSSASIDHGDKAMNILKKAAEVGAKHAVETNPNTVIRDRVEQIVKGTKPIAAETAPTTSQTAPTPEPKPETLKPTTSETNKDELKPEAQSVPTAHSMEGKSEKEILAHQIAFLKRYEAQQSIADAGKTEHVTAALAEASARLTALGGNPEEIKMMEARQFRELPVADVAHVIADFANKVPELNSALRANLQPMALAKLDAIHENITNKDVLVTKEDPKVIVSQVVTEKSVAEQAKGVVVGTLVDTPVTSTIDEITQKKATLQTQIISDYVAVENPDNMKPENAATWEKASERLEKNLAELEGRPLAEIKALKSGELKDLVNKHKKEQHDGLKLSDNVIKFDVKNQEKTEQVIVNAIPETKELQLN